MSLTDITISVDKIPFEKFQQEPNLAPDIEAVIHKYEASLRLYAKVELGCEDAVDEILQQTWVALYNEGVKSGIEWLHSSTIYGWLRSVVHNRVYDYQKQPKTISLDTEEVMLKVEQRTDTLEHPDTISVRNEMALEILDVILHTIKPGDAFIMLCSHYLEYSSKDLARMLNCPENTVKSRLRRARERLGKALEDRGIQARDIRQVGGLKERLDQILAWLALDAVPRDEWDNEIVQSILQRKGEHPSWAFIAFDFLNKWDIDVAARYQVCCHHEPPRRLLYGVTASFYGRDGSQAPGNVDRASPLRYTTPK